MSRWTMVLGCLAAAACAKRSAPAAAEMSMDGEYGGSYGYYEADDAPMAPPPPPPAAAPVVTLEKQKNEADAAKYPQDPGPAGSETTGEERPAPEPGTATAAQSPAAPRMVHYTGWARLRVTKVQETLDALAAIATESGGRVERLGATSITIRVPVATFAERWKAALALGDVLEKSVGAEDVTEAFTAVDLRVKILRTTRDRLVQLLAKAETEDEKLQLLRELQRVTEELDGLESQLRAIRGLADFSTITIELVPREAAVAGGDEPEIGGFGWIRALSPFNHAPLADDKRVELPVPTGMVGLTRHGPWVAESPEGAALWTSRLVNDPRASATFWIDAVADRLASEFAAATPSTVGDWQCLRLVDGSDEPYSWEVCVRGDDDDRNIDVAQAYYPDDAAFERYHEAVRAALVGGGDAVAQAAP